uniref:Uncharacterized protein n=1 Tax=Arundo donax TaxID=35708 RepID=A0A0A8ZG62_ARUDO
MLSLVQTRRPFRDLLHASVSQISFNLSSHVTILRLYFSCQSIVFVPRSAKPWCQSESSGKRKHARMHEHDSINI